MQKLFKYIESGIVILLALVTISIIIPFSDMFNFRDMIQEAKTREIFYEFDLPKQEYFNRTLEIDGLIYDPNSNEAYIFMTSRNLYNNSLPNWPTLTVITSNNIEKEIMTAGGGGSSNALRTRGYYHFSDLPQNIEEMVLSKEQYGQSFSFSFDLSGGADSNE
ncbi:hypothetical protein [Bacillus sp. Marseille-P3661]|uniref:hypothetical protein n=1 Tax=Bacillus sp. Marseille-P3661 TaxID=1936234 RepID=UPI000C863D7F|nr:hypothetical protein [Bacillus sp. Marseille-P3661]